MPELVYLDPLSPAAVEEFVPATSLVDPVTGLASLAMTYSGVVVNQNVRPDAPNDLYSIDAGSFVLQEFFLPDGYRRGTESSEVIFPSISGLQIMVECLADSNAASVDWFLEYQLFGSGWTRVASGSSVGLATEGPRSWFNIFFDSPVGITESIVKSRMRFGIKATKGISRWWYSAPNPLNLPNRVKAYAANGTTPLIRPTDNAEFSFCFRVLGLTVDEGTDYLGNPYRSAVRQTSPVNISTALGADRDSYWLSKPNPSKFAVEALYFDVRKADDAVSVIDRVIIDPITPGPYFSIYYSDEGDMGQNERDWEDKLWTRVPQTYRMERRETHVLPSPVKAKFIKIEFSHLQAKYYAPGDFQQSIRYKKHPKWVLDYFLARVAANLQNPFLAERVAVVFDALDLAYNYYLDDLGQEPQATIDVNNTALTQITNFLSDRSDASDRIDPATLDKINLSLDPYRQHPALRGTSDTLLADYSRQTIDFTADYAIEEGAPTTIRTAEVSSLNRDRVVVEQNYPVMFFFLTCRHAYREIEAKFSHDRAYFVGVRELAFLRDNYMTAFDTSTYIEPNADTLNIERNDFVS